MKILGYNWYELVRQYWTLTDIEKRTQWNKTIEAAYGLGVFCWFLIVLVIVGFVIGMVFLGIWVQKNKYYWKENKLERQKAIKNLMEIKYELENDKFILIGAKENVDIKLEQKTFIKTIDGMINDVKKRNYVDNYKIAQMKKKLEKFKEEITIYFEKFGI